MGPPMVSRRTRDNIFCLLDTVMNCSQIVTGYEIQIEWISYGYGIRQKISEGCVIWLDFFTGYRIHIHPIVAPWTYTTRENHCCISVVSSCKCYFSCVKDLFTCLLLKKPWKRSRQNLTVWLKLHLRIFFFVTFNFFRLLQQERYWFNSPFYWL